MILIFGNWTNDPKEFEGMVLRIRDIDNAFVNCHRVYLQFTSSFWTLPVIKKINSQQEFVKINLKNPWHLLYLAKLFFKSQMIYAHSLLNLNSVILKLFLQIFYFKKLAVDLHGVVPEEFAYSNNNLLSKQFETLEAWVISRASIVVAVSLRMKEHFQDKYGPDSLSAPMLKSPQWILIPTSATTEPPADWSPSEKFGPRSILYSGGLQSWQNIVDVLSLFSKLASNGYKCSFFTYNLAELENLSLSYPNLAASWNVGHLNLQELEKEYACHDFGVVLRDPVVVNRVACPTKIMDYLAWGLVPVVKSKEIGDFVEWGAPFVYAEQVDALSANDVLELKRAAIKCFAQIQMVRQRGFSELKNLCANLD